MSTTGYAFATLRHRKGAFVGAAVALFCAAALIAACGSLLTTGILGTIAPERYAATPLLVTADQNVHELRQKGHGKTKEKAKPVTDRAWIPADVADRLRALPGVATVSTEVTFPAYVAGARTDESWGHGWESAPLGGLTLAAGRAPAAADEVVLDATTARRAGAVAGSTVAVRLASGTAMLRVVGVTRQGFEDQTGIFFTPERARELAGHAGLVSAIGVFPASGTAVGRLEAEIETALAAVPGTPADDASASASTTSRADTADAIGTADATGSRASTATATGSAGTSTSPTTPTLHTADARGPAEFLATASSRVRLVSIGAVLAATSLIVAILVVVGTFGLSIQQRQREIAVLRAVAATPRQVRRLIGGEALLVGAVAAALGITAGLPLSAWLHARFVALGVVAGNLRPSPSPFPYLVSFLLTLAAAWTAARLSARRATRVRPVEALGAAELRPGRIPVVRALAGVLTLLAATVLCLVLPLLHSDAAAQPVTFVAALLGCTAVALLGPLLVRAAFAVIGRPLARFGAPGTLAAANLRTAAHRAASVVTPLALLTAMACTILFTSATTGAAASGQQTAGVRADYVIGSKVPADTVAAVRAVPGVRSVTAMLHATVRVGLSNTRALAVTPTDLPATLDLGVTAGSLAALATTPDPVAASTASGHRLGDRLTLTLPDGTPASLTVVALYDRGLGFGDLTLPYDLLARHVDVPFAESLLVRAPGVPLGALQAAVRDEPGIGVIARAATPPDPDDTGTKIGYVILGLIITFCAIAVLNTLAMTVSDRGRELLALRRIGATRGQLLRMLAGETAAIAALATLLGLGVAYAVLTGYASGMTGAARPALPLGTLGSVLGGAVALAGVATYLPARAVLRGGGRARG